MYNICIFIHSLVFSLESRAWQEPELSHVKGIALAHCILGKFLGVVCHCFPPPLDVPNLAARCLRPQQMIFFALKIRLLRSGLNPQTWVLKASTLPLEHRSRYI